MCVGKAKRQNWHKETFSNMTVPVADLSACCEFQHVTDHFSKQLCTFLFFFVILSSTAISQLEISLFMLMYVFGWWRWWWSI